MPVTNIQSSIATENNASSAFTLTWPSGTASSSRCLAFIYQRISDTKVATITAPVGWQSVGRYLHAGLQGVVEVFTITNGSVRSGNEVFSWQDSADAVGVLAEFSPSAIAVNNGGSTGFGATPTSGQISTTANSYIIGAIASTNGEPQTNPTGGFSTLEFTSSANTAAVARIQGGLYVKNNASAGTHEATVSISTGRAYCGVALALEETSASTRRIHRSILAFDGASALAGRDALLHPFASPSAVNANDGSVWNTPIGASATLLPAGLADALGNAQNRVTVDPIFVAMNTSSPVKDLTYSTRVNGNTIGVPPNQVPQNTTVRIPNSMTHQSQWNGCAAIIDGTDDNAFWTGQPLDRAATADNPGWYYTPVTDDAVRGRDTLDGLGRLGSHGGSGLSALGGCLREWEYYGSGQIRHALSINLFGERFLSPSDDGSSESGPGYRWPARKADSGFNSGTNTGNSNNYGRTTPAYSGMKMGTLLCLPAGYDASWITDSLVQRMAWTMEKFGGYVVDNTKRDVHAFSVEESIEIAWRDRGATFHGELMALMNDLYYVDNSGSGAVGGGGAFRTTPPLPIS